MSASSSSSNRRHAQQLLPIANYFCQHCSSILPISLLDASSLKCGNCRRAFDIDKYNGRQKLKVFKFSKSGSDSQTNANTNNEESTDGTNRSKVERVCEKCGNNEMYFVARQIRSADEGQTVFYTCTKCGHKVTED